MATITVPDRLISTIGKFVRNESFSSEDEFIQEAIAEKLLLSSLVNRKEEVKKMTSRIQEKMVEKGITEEEILDDFKDFRRQLYK